MLYGQPDVDPIECPYCELVAFTSPEVLQMHLAKFHPDQFEQQAVTSAVASALAAPDSDSEPEHRNDDEGDKDWSVDENGLRTPPGPAAVLTPMMGAGDGIVRRGRGGRGRGDFSNTILFFDKLYSCLILSVFL